MMQGFLIGYGLVVAIFFLGCFWAIEGKLAELKALNDAADSRIAAAASELARIIDQGFK